MPEPRTVTSLRSYRERAGLSQAALAERIGLSRQALAAIESGRQVPSTAVALSLAGSLGQSVEDLFQLRHGGGVPVRLAPLPGVSLHGPAVRTRRVALARIDDDWVAHRLVDDGGAAADGLLAREANGRTARVEVLADVQSLERNVLVSGCAPLLGVLAQRVGRRFVDARATFLPANTERSLALLADGLVHVAGIHLGAEEEARAHEAVLRRRLPGRDMVLVNLTRWRVGLAVAPGNPLDVREPGDLLRDDVRFVAREAGAGTTRLLGHALAGGVVPRPAAPTATGHAAVADLIRYGAGDAGLTIESAALAAGLDFLPWIEERFDLLVMREHAVLPSVARFLGALGDPAFRAEAAQLPGYDGSDMGRVSTIRS